MTTSSPIHLSTREREILHQYALGRTTKQMASHYAISTTTVKTYLDRIRTRLERSGHNRDREAINALAVRDLKDFGHIFGGSAEGPLWFCARCGNEYWLEAVGSKPPTPCIPKAPTVAEHEQRMRATHTCTDNPCQHAFND